MNADRGAFSGPSLWAIRWALATLFMLQIAAGWVGLETLSYPRPFVNIWVGAAIAGPVAFFVALIVQRRLGPNAIAENRATLWFLGAIAIANFAVGAMIATGVLHAG